MSNPLVPVMGGAGGAIVAHGGQYIRQAVLTVFEQLGGAQGLKNWVDKHPDNETAFYTKLAPKLIPKEVQVSDKRSVDDIIMSLDDIPDAQYVEVPRDEAVADEEDLDHYE